MAKARPVGKLGLRIALLSGLFFNALSMSYSNSATLSSPAGIPVGDSAPHHAIDVEIKLSKSGSAFPTINGVTNLPDGIILSVILHRPRSPDAEQRLAEGLPACRPDCRGWFAKAIVKGRRFSTGPMALSAVRRDGSRGLDSGDYYVSIGAGPPFSPAVRANIGGEGDYLTGPQVTNIGRENDILNIIDFTGHIHIEDNEANRRKYETNQAIGVQFEAAMNRSTYVPPDQQIGASLDIPKNSTVDIIQLNAARIQDGASPSALRYERRGAQIYKLFGEANAALICGARDDVWFHTISAAMQQFALQDSELSRYSMADQGNIQRFFRQITAEAQNNVSHDCKMLFYSNKLSDLDRFYLEMSARFR